MLRRRSRANAEVGHEGRRADERASLTRILERSARQEEHEREVQEKQVYVNGFRTNYLEAGSGDRCLLLIHGGVNNTARSTWSKWNRSIEVFSRDYKVFAPDLPGYGSSDAPKNCTQEYYVDFIKGFLGAVGVQKASIVGTSMGGGIALGYAINNMGSVESLILIGPYGLGFSMPRTSRLALAIPTGAIDWGVKFLDRHKEFAGRIVKRMFGDESADTMVKAIGFMNEGGVKKSFFDYISNEAITLKGVLRGSHTGMRTDYTDDISLLNNSNIKVLFIEGENDTLVRLDTIKSAASKLKNAEVLVVEGCKHSPHFQEPEIFNGAVKSFLLRTFNESEQN